MECLQLMCVSSEGQGFKSLRQAETSVRVEQRKRTAGGTGEKHNGETDGHK